MRVSRRNLSGLCSAGVVAHWVSSLLWQRKLLSTGDATSCGRSGNTLLSRDRRAFETTWAVKPQVRDCHLPRIFRIAPFNVNQPTSSPQSISDTNH